jgi:hypothetical protein
VDTVTETGLLADGCESMLTVNMAYSATPSVTVISLIDIPGLVRAAYAADCMQSKPMTGISSHLQTDLALFFILPSPIALPAHGWPHANTINFFKVKSTIGAGSAFSKSLIVIRVIPAWLYLDVLAWAAPPRSPNQRTSLTDEF